MTFFTRTAACAALLGLMLPCAIGQPRSASAATPASQASGYRSVFDGHRGFDDAPLRPWRESNDLVGRIGGWQAYARESQGIAAPATAASAPAGTAR